MVFFITTDSRCNVERLFKPYCYFGSHEEFQLFKAESLQAAFIGCQKIELDKQTVFIYGRAFPPKGEDLKSCLEEIVKRDRGQERMNGNFNLIIFNKDDSSFSLFGDRHGSLPIFFSNFGGCIKISSFFELILKDNRDYRFNERALLDYLCLGYVLPGESLWRSVQIAPRDKYLRVFPLRRQLFLKDVVFKGRREVYYSSLKECGEIFIERLKETLEDEFNFLDIPRLDLTGGADTRILLSCMDEARLRGLSYRTFESAFWDDTNYDGLVADQLAERFDLDHFKSRSYKMSEPDFFHLSYVSFRDQKRELKNTISGMFGSELFGGAVLAADSLLDYKISDRIDKIKAGLFGSVITVSDYKRVGSPWERLKYRIIHSGSLFREQDVVQQIVLRSQWSSMYSKYNVSGFVIPYHYIRSSRVCPYIDVRMIDFYLSCPREFLLNYILYEYVFLNVLDKSWREVAFYSDMMKYVEAESFSKWRPEEVVVNDVCAKPLRGYGLYFERGFSSDLFEGVFLERLSVKDVRGIPEGVLFKICDLICFVSELKAEE